MNNKQICGNCKFSRKEYDDVLSCKKSSQDIYITQGWGVELSLTVKPDETCEEWKKK